MKLAHLADLHLGFRQYARQTSQGINQREADVAGAFRRALDGVIAEQPDIVLIAGDLFHSVRPTNTAILDAFNQFRRLREALPDAPIVIIAGNHDTPRSVETGTILKLFEAVEGVHVAALEARRFVFPELDCAVLAVPHAAWVGSPRPALERDPSARWNVLMVHGEVAGLLPHGDPALEYGGAVFEPRDLAAGGWDYVALGHYHVATAVQPNQWYAGAPEFVSTNPWGEAREAGDAGAPGRKGWLSVTLGGENGCAVAFRAVPPARRVIDLEPIDAAGATAADVDGLIAARVAAAGGIAQQIVRQVVRNVARTTARDLDHAAIRALKADALHYQLDLRRPAPARAVGVAAPGRRQTLPELVQAYLRDRRLTPGVDRQRLIALARTYVEAAERDAEEST
ncbi:MAG TPA: DNA repair exonuclease [Gemmatimonadales bacterium]|nr:DNA repair exonuclease [Gemmatimonadales bacterium]